MKTLAVPMVLCRFQWQSDGRSLKVCEFPTRWETFPNGLKNISQQVGNFIKIRLGVSICRVLQGLCMLWVKFCFYR